MDDDIVSAIRGQPTVDPVLATIYAEASQDPTERKAVAAVIANRAKASGKSPADIINEPGQFEAVTSKAGRARMASLTPDSDAYKQLVSQVQPVLAGQEDPTGGATSYYAPQAQAALGRAKPSFDDGNGQQIGQQLFFGGTPPMDADIVGAIRGQSSNQPLAAPSAGATTSAAPGQRINDLQQAFFTKYGAGKQLDQNAEKGSAANPFAQVKEGEIPDQPGAYYVDLKGVLQRTPGGDTDANDVAKAYAAGDTQKGQQLARDMVQKQEAAFGNRLLSGALLGGKNEAGAILTHPIEFAHGGFDNPIIRGTISASDARDALQHAQHPMASDAGAITGALGGGGALSLLTGGAADLLPAAGPAAIAGRLGLAGAEGGALGGANSFLASDGGNAQRAAAAKQGAKIGAVAGPMGEIASEGGSLLANKILGSSIAPESAALAKTAMDKYGIKLRGGQIADTPSTSFFDSVLQRTPLTGYAKSSGGQLSAFNQAVAKTIGEDAGGLTPEVMQRARTRLGNEFDRIGAATTIKDTPQLSSDLDSIVSDAKKVLTDKSETPLVNQIKDIKSAFTKDADGNDVLTGEAYLNLTKKGTPLDRLTKDGNVNIAHYAQAIKSSLLDAVSRNAAPEDVAALQQAKAQYARMKTLEPLAEKAGPEGEISPALLLQAMRSNYDNLAYDGGGDLGELARIGQRFLKEPPSSGTAERLAAKKALETAGLVGTGGGALWLSQHPEEAAKLGLGAGAALGTTLLAGKLGAVALDNPLYRNMLLRSASGAAGVVGKGKRPTLVNPANAAILANRITTQ